MSNDKIPDDLIQHVLSNPNIILKHDCRALHEVTRQAEQALRAQENKPKDVEPKESKK